MKAKSTQRITGEIITLIQNILITVGVVILLFNMFIIENIFKSEWFNELREFGIDLTVLENYKWMIIGLLLIIIIFNWLLRELSLLTSSKGVLIFILILNIFNIIGLIGYSLILYDNIVITEKGLNPSEINNRGTNITIFLIVLLINILIFGTIYLNISTKNIDEVNNRNPRPYEYYNESSHNENILYPETENSAISKTDNIDKQTTLLEDDNDKSQINMDIRADYENIAQNAMGLFEKQLGFFRYYDLMITTLRSYDTNNIKNAKTVYELSDKLLNDLYEMYSGQLIEDELKIFINNQIRWVQVKEQYELNTNDDELHKYKHLINITLNKCHEWVSYYNGM